MKPFGRRKPKRRTSKKRVSALGQRRKRMFRIKFGLSIFVVLIIVVVLGWLLRHPEVTINNLVITGNNLTQTAAIKGVVDQELDTSYLFVVPKRSTFFFPKNQIAKRVDEAFPRISEVTVRKQNFTTLRVEVKERSPFALWCGDNFVEDGEQLGNCYFIDDKSYLYAGAPDFTGNVFFKYFGVLNELDGTAYSPPIGSTYMTESDFFGIRPFIEAFEELGYTPVSLTRMSDGDFELRMNDKAKIIFGHETLLSVLLDNMESILESDSFKESEGKVLEYIDLRFGNKVYYKFRDDDEVPSLIEEKTENDVE